MSTTTPAPKKPPSTGTNSTNTGRRTPAATSTSSNGATPNRSPSRMAAQQSTSAASAINRERSIRNGTPVSARAAARKPASIDAGAGDDARAEMQARLDELQEKLQQTELAYEESQKHSEVLQIKLDDALKEQGILEDSVHEHTERVEELENEKRESLRARREFEQIYEAERVQTMREKEEAQAREEEMHGAMQRMKETLAHRDLRERTSLSVDDERRPSVSRTSSMRSNDPSPNPEARDGSRQFAPSSSLQRSDSRSSSRLVMQKDKIIEGLRLELAEAQIKLVELENKGGGRLHELEKEMYDIKMQNARLMEENESFQLLLSEKTLNGDLAQSELLRPPPEDTSVSSRPSSRSPAQERGRASLADELEGVDSLDSAGADAPDSAIDNPKERRLQGEVNSLKDQNKALTLYINNIISRLLQHEQFEAILDKTPDLMAGPGAASRKYLAQRREMEAAEDAPPPPPPKDDPEQGGQSLLQRAGSVLRGNRPGGTKPPRPTSMIQGQPAPALTDSQTQPLPIKSEDQPTVHENPSTAPRIPLGRTGSTRGGAGAAGHRRTHSDWPAANVVTSMYRGPSPGLHSPTSVGGSVGARSSFFAGRVPSASSVPTTTLEEGKENEAPGQQQGTAFDFPSQSRDSKVGGNEDIAPLRPSNRNSVISNPATFNDPSDASSSLPPGSSSASTNIAADQLSNPSSPPRSTTSSGDRDGRPSGGAVMMGSKPRPLRLVQEASSQEADERARKAANRGSWFGWMNKGGAPGSTGGFGNFLPGQGGQQQ